MTRSVTPRSNSSVCSLPDSVTFCVLTWRFSFATFCRKTSIAETYCVFFFSVKCCQKLFFFPTLFFLKKKNLHFACSVFPFSFLHGILELKGIRIRSRTRRRGNVAITACCCLCVRLKYNAWKIKSVVNQAYQSLDPCYTKTMKRSALKGILQKAHFWNLLILTFFMLKFKFYWFRCTDFWSV